MPTAGVRQQSWRSIQPCDERNLPLAKAQRRFHSLEKARSVFLRHGSAILYYPHHCWQMLGGGFGFIGAQNRAIDPNAQIPLALKKREEIRRRRPDWRRHAKRHEHCLPARFRKTLRDNGRRRLWLD